MKKNKYIFRLFYIFMIVGLVISQMNYIVYAATDNTILINEVESSDENGGNDWIEIINTGINDIDISNWFVSDDKGLERISDGTTWLIAEGTILKAGSVLVLEQEIDFDFGLGKADQVTLYNTESQTMDSYSWLSHAVGTYSRVPGGTEFVDQAPTKGLINVLDVVDPIKKGVLVINEINSSPDDWVEFINTGDVELDISDYEIRDNSDDHRWKFAQETIIQPGELLLVSADTVGLIYNDQTTTYSTGEFQTAIGIGSGDSIRLYNTEGILIDSYSWSQHASYNGDAALASYGRYPDGTGSFSLVEETPGTTNIWYAPQVVINEVESDGDTTDWVEVYNAGSASVDITGWYILDNDPVGHSADITPIATTTIIEPGQFYVFDQNVNFTFGLGKADQVVIYNADGTNIAEYTWTQHATGVYARIPDGTGALVDFPISTKGKANVIVSPVVINEVQSNDPDNGPDWIELANPTNAEINISGLILKDNDDSHEYIIPEGTTIAANGYLVLIADDFGFGLGSSDSVRLYEGGLLIGSTSWTTHTNPTWGLYPNVNGAQYQNTKGATPGSANVFDGIPEVITWTGNQEVTTFDTTAMFLEDSSGLDFYNGQLYAVDNGTGKFWILDVAEDGTLTFADGFENGKIIRFQKDAGNSSAAGPDAEGITVDGDNLVYVASERDNSAKSVNYNTILQIDPYQEGTSLVTLNEWDLTASLPQVSANMGIEAVEWVANEDVNGTLFDKNTNAPFASNNYPDAVANGVFFVALEDNGHVYAYVLNNDGSVIQIADIDSKLGGAMALDFDTYENILWVVTDDGYGNKAAQITLTGESETGITHLLAPTGLDSTRNNEGFAIAEASYTVAGQRPVYRFADGYTSGALTIGSLATHYNQTEETDHFEFAVDSLDLKVGDKVKVEIIHTTQTISTQLTKVAESISYQWFSSDNSVFTVDQEGNVEAVGAGNAEIEVIINGTNTIRLSVNVTDNKTLELLGWKDSLTVGESITLIPTIDGNIGATGWTWNNEYLTASFNSPATFTALKSGTTTITFTTLNGETIEKILTITDTSAIIEDSNNTSNDNGAIANDTLPYTGVQDYSGLAYSFTVFGIMFIIIVNRLKKTKEI